MKVTYGIGCCNEIEELKRLLPFILQHKQEQDEVVVQWDSSGGTQEVVDYVTSFDNVVFAEDNLRDDEGPDFAAFKNRLLDRSTGDWHFQIDADEVPSVGIMQILHDFLANADADLVGMARADIIVCDSQETFNKMNQVCNFRPKQWLEGYGMLLNVGTQRRLIKVGSDIRWAPRLHEQPKHEKKMDRLPFDGTMRYVLHHDKTPERQHKQHWFYHDECGQRIGTEHLRGSEFDFSGN